MSAVTAAQLQMWADSAREIRNGWGCVWIADAWRVARLHGSELTLDEFKAAIAADAGCRACLKRLDLAGAFPAAQQSESETSYMTASWHLVRRA